MSPKKYLVMSLVVLLAVFTLVPSAYADGEDTMMVVEEGATPDDIVKIIELPGFASATGHGAGHGKAAFGQEKGKEAKSLGKEFGQQMAEEAKNKNMSEQARDNARQNARREARGNNGQGNRPGG